MNYIKMFMTNNDLGFNELFYVYYKDDDKDYYEGLFCIVNTKDGVSMERLTLGAIDNKSGYYERVLLDILSGEAYIKNV